MITRTGATVALILAATFALAAPVYAAETAVSAAVSDDTSATDESRLLVSLTNELRESLELTPLKHSVDLNRVAQAWVDKMASGEVQYMHNPDVYDEIPQGWALAGENIAYRSDRDVNAIQQQWVNSPGHYANLTRVAFTHMGAAIAYSPEGRMYGVQVFATYFDDLPVVTPPTLEPTPEPTPTLEPTPEPTPTLEPTPEPTPITTSTPDPEPTPTHTPDPEPTPTHTPDPEPTREPTPDPEPTTKPSPEKSADAKPVVPRPKEATWPVPAIPAPPVTDTEPGADTPAPGPGNANDAPQPENQPQVDAAPSDPEAFAVAPAASSKPRQPVGIPAGFLWAGGSVLAVGGGVGCGAAFSPRFRTGLMRLFGAP